MKTASKRIYIILAVITACVLVYGKSINYGFVWDDERTHLTGNKQLMSGNSTYFFKKPYEGLYAPIPYTIWTKLVKSQQLNAHKKLDPKSFHKLNITLHVLCCIGVVFVLSLLFSNQWAILLGTLIFAIHPLQTETVVWISEARGLWAALFMIYALYAYLSFKINRQNAYMYGACILYAFALISKPSVIVFPFIVILFELLYFKSEQIKKYIPVFIFMVLSMPIVFLTPGFQPPKVSAHAVTFFEKFLFAFTTVDFYILKIIFPWSLSPSYGFNVYNISGLKLYIGVLSAIALVACVKFYWSKIPNLVIIGFGVFIISLLPTSGIVPFYFQKFSTVADRYAYLSIIGIAIVVSSLIERFNSNKMQYFISAIIILFAFKNYSYSEVWRNELALWQHADNEFPEQLHVNINLGVALHDNGKYKAAIEKYDKAISIDPTMAKTYTNRGNSYAFIMNFNKAIEDYSLSIKLDSGYANAYYNRSITFFQLNKLPEAYQDMLKAERLGYYVNPAFKNDLLRGLSIESNRNQKFK